MWEKPPWWPTGGGTDLLGLVGVGQRDDHPDDVEVVEGGAGAEGAGQHCRLTPGHLDAALGHGHVQGLNTHCRGQTGGATESAFFKLLSLSLTHTHTHIYGSKISCLDPLGHRS